MSKLLLISTFFLCMQTSFASPSLRIENRRFVDAKGDTVILKGINAFGTSKTPPFSSDEDPKIFTKIHDLGYNHVRLLFNWEAYEPARGQFNESYLSHFKNMAIAAWAADLYVLVDFHQDAYSRFVSRGCGEGFPLWTLPQGVTPAIADNSSKCLNWVFYALTDVDTYKSWNHFYADTYNVKSHYLSMLRMVVKNLKSIEGVIGYDIINEPWGWEGTQISEFYVQAASVISSVDPTAIVFIEPHPTAGLGLAGQTKLLKPTFKNAVYAPHLYDFNVLALGFWNGSTKNISAILAQHQAKADEWNVPLYIGEWGAPADATDANNFINAMWTLLDQNAVSSAQWNITPGWNASELDGFNGENLSIIDDAGRTRLNFVERPQVHKVPGRPLSINSNLLSFKINWTQDILHPNGSLVIFLPKEWRNPIYLRVSNESVTCLVKEYDEFLRCHSTQPGSYSVSFTRD